MRLQIAPAPGICTLLGLPAPVLVVGKALRQPLGLRFLLALHVKRVRHRTTAVLPAALVPAQGRARVTAPLLLHVWLTLLVKESRVLIVLRHRSQLLLILGLFPAFSLLRLRGRRGALLLRLPALLLEALPTPLP